MTFLALQDAAPLWIDTAAGSMDIVGGWLICFLTLAVFSFLYKDNPFYKVAEHIFVGAGTAYFALQYYKEGILEPLYDHIERAVDTPAGGFIQLGGYGVDPTTAIIFRSIAVLFALMLVSRLFWPNSWAPRWPLAVMVGVYAALKMTGETQSKLVLQIKGAMKPLTDDTRLGLGDNWQRIEETGAFYTFANVVLVVGVVCALSHFIFTYKRGPILGSMSRVGIITLMITFGSMFGFTVLGRIALLIERVSQLGDYTSPEYSLYPDGAQSSFSLFGAIDMNMSQLTSPPFLVATLITLVLALGAIQKRGKPA